MSEILVEKRPLAIITLNRPDLDLKDRAANTRLGAGGGIGGATVRFGLRDAPPIVRSDIDKPTNVRRDNSGQRPAHGSRPASTSCASSGSELRGQRPGFHGAT